MTEHELVDEPAPFPWVAMAALVAGVGLVVYAAKAAGVFDRLEELAAEELAGDGV